MAGGDLSFQQAQHSDGSLLREPGCLPPPLHVEVNVSIRMTASLSPCRVDRAHSEGYFQHCTFSLTLKRTARGFRRRVLSGECSCVSCTCKARQPKHCSCSQQRQLDVRARLAPLTAGGIGFWSLSGARSH